MSATVPIYLEFSDDVEQFLVENEISLEEILQQANIDADVTHQVRPDLTGEEERTKEVVLVVLASAALVLAVGTAISQVLQTHYRRPRLEQIDSIEEVMDADGNVVSVKVESRPELLEPRETDSERKTEAILNKDGFILRFGSSEKQSDTEA
jgi:hypothetical protein